MMRVLLAPLFLLVAISAAAAQGPTAPAAPKPTDTLSAAQAQQALDVLRDPAKRAQVITVLEALAKAAPTPAAPPAAPAATPAAVPAAAPAAPTIPLAPDSLGAQILVDASQHLSALSGEVVGTARAMTDFPLIWRAVVDLATDPWSQTMMLQTGWRLLLVMVSGLAAQWAVRRLLHRAQRSLARRSHFARRPGEPTPENLGIAEAEAGQTEQLRHRVPVVQALRRLPFVLARLALILLAPLAMLAVGYGMLGAGLAPDSITRLVILGVLHAYVLCRVATSLSRVVVGPGEPRLLHAGDATAHYVLRWVRRIAAIAIFGYTLAEIGLLFGLYPIAHDALLKLVALVVHVLLAVIVLQKRAAVAQWIRARDGADGMFAVLRNRLAGVWHFIAIFYLLALWVVWALDVPGGFARLLELFFVSVAILIVARMLTTLVLQGVERAIHVPPELAERYPGLESRMGTYHPILRAVCKTVIGAVAVVALLQAWGWDALAWFGDGALGGRLVDAIGTIAITLVLALAVWEGTNAAIQRHLARLAREAQIGRSARLRTLLPMVRTALFITIALVAGLMVLSQIGLNIAPLLAGAGVIGLAIGFGSQKLVQDIITGLFLLLENAMQVGDVVNLASLTGTVENLSVRTIRLRALDGAVHIVPFSAVTTVTNMTRDFAYAVIDVEAGLNEEPDRIADVLRGVAKEMRAEPRWQAAIRDDLEVLGVDKFIENAWVLRVRIKTTPSQRWPVQRELNRRIKYRFDALAIESPITSFRVLQQHVPSAPPTTEAPTP